jgi:hypothetical protein
MSTPIELDINGTIYKGSYSVDGNQLTARYRGQAMMHEVGRTAPAIAARRMLQKLVRLVPEAETGKADAA